MHQLSRDNVFANATTLAEVDFDPQGVIDTDFCVWEIGDYSVLFRRLIGFLDLVLESDDVAFDIQLTQSGKSYKVRSQRLVNYFSNLNTLLDICFEGYAYSADIELFCDCYALLPGIAECAFVRPGRPLFNGVIEAEIFNDFVAYMRTEAERRGVKKSMRDWKYGMTSVQEERIRTYLWTMPHRTTKLLAVRCELQYRIAAPSTDEVMIREVIGGVRGRQDDERIGNRKPESRARFDIARALGHRERFFSNPLGRDKLLFRHLIGYVWKVEQDEGGIIHHHVVFIFDGQCVKDDLTALGRIARRWEAITEGAGYMHSSHYRKKEFIEKGRWHFGNIDCRAPESLGKMIDDVALYFTKDEQPLRFKPSRRTRTLTMGLSHQPRQGGPGRPRKVARA